VVWLRVIELGLCSQPVPVEVQQLCIVMTILIATCQIKSMAHSLPLILLLGDPPFRLPSLALLLPCRAPFSSWPRAYCPTRSLAGEPLSDLHAFQGRSSLTPTFWKDSCPVSCCRKWADSLKSQEPSWRVFKGKSWNRQFGKELRNMVHATWQSLGNFHSPRSLQFAGQVALAPS
jgi:hypothetical protein